MKSSRSRGTPQAYETRSRANKVAQARKHRTQYTGATHADFVCSYCGYIYDGPDTGAHIKHPTHVGIMPSGIPLSHGRCDPPCAPQFQDESHFPQPPQPARRPR